MSVHFGERSALSLACIPELVTIAVAGCGGGTPWQFATSLSGAQSAARRRSTGQRAYVMTAYREAARQDGRASGGGCALTRFAVRTRREAPYSRRSIPDGEKTAKAPSEPAMEINKPSAGDLGDCGSPRYPNGIGFRTRFKTRDEFARAVRRCSSHRLTKHQC